MAKEWRFERRDKKLKSRKSRMPKHGRSVLLLEEITRQKAEKARKEIRENVEHS